MYVTHARETIENLNEGLPSLEKNPEDVEVVNECFRHAHTLKGMANTMTFKNTGELSHAMENILDAIKTKRIEPAPDVMDVLFRCIDTLELMVDAVKEKNPEPEATDIMMQIQELLKGLPEEEEAAKKEEAPSKDKKKTDKKTEKKPKEKTDEEKEPKKGKKKIIGLSFKFIKECDMPSARAILVIKKLEESGRVIETKPIIDEIEADKFGREFSIWLETDSDEKKLIESVSRFKCVEEVSQETRPPEHMAKKEVAAGPPKRGIREIASVRVKMDRLDDLLDSVGELVINKIRLQEISRNTDSAQLSEAMRSLDRLTSEMQYNVLRIRMVPIDTVFSRFPRLVRDLSRQTGKEIELIMEGHEIELDRTMIDKLGDLLVHLLKNSIDHGIEMPNDRDEVGKPRAGIIRLSAVQEQNRVMIKVEDDGKGIDLEKIRKKALEKNVCTQEELQDMTDEEICGFLATPGFSTADKVTEISGRGVGLDAVKSGVESFGGQMIINSVRGEGTKIVIRLPLTLAIILAMLVRIGTEIYAISVDPIVETISIKDPDIKTIGGMRVAKFRGEIIPLIYLSQLLGVSDENKATEVIVVEINQQKSGLIVDELLGQQEIVVKPLDKHLRKVSFLGGATILGSGEVALILDIQGLSAYARDQMKITTTSSADEIKNVNGGVTNARD